MNFRKTSAPVLALAAAGLASVLAAVSASGLRADDAPAAARAPGDQDAIKARAFSADRCKARRDALLAKVEKGTLVVLSSGKDEGGDARRHRAVRDFVYLTGIEDPECWLVLENGTSTLYAKPQRPGSEIWTGEHVTPGEKTAKQYGFDAAVSSEGVKKALVAAVASASKVLVSGTTPKELRALASIEDGKSVNSAAGTIGLLRQVKDEDEIALVRRAAEISATAFHACARAIAPERYEFEVQGLFEGCCRFYGAEDQGYPSIVGSGKNSCTLHYDADRRQMKAGDMLVLDAAGECGLYSADVTRTFPVSGKFTEEQRRVYEAVRKAQDAGIATCVPGKTIGDVHQAAAAVLKSEGLAKYLPHGVSHWLGLDVHDAGDYARALEPGMILTVEPGCYIADKALGVRIEDDILVTDHGPVNLSAYAPRGADEVEALLLRARSGSTEMPPLPGAPAPAARPSSSGREYH